MDWSGLVLVLCVLFATPGCVWGKLCCDQGCKHPVSYGRTVQRHITKDEGFLSYPASAIVTIFSKDVLTTAEGEYWGAEIQGKRGLILNNALKELTHKCVPSEQLQEEEPLVPDDGEAAAPPTDHTHMDTPTSMDQTQPSTSTPSDGHQPRPDKPLTPGDQSQDSSPLSSSNEQREMPQSEQGVPPVEAPNIQYQEPSGSRESVEQRYQREREREVRQREEREQMPPIDRFQDPTGSRESVAREPLREETQQVHVNVSPDNEPEPTEENKFQTVSLNIHPSSIPTQPDINIPPVLADEHLNFAGNLHEVPTSGDSRPQETPLAEPSPPQQHQQRDQQYLNDGRQNGESQEQDEEPFGKQVHRVKDIYIDELDEDELDKDESYAEITPKTPSEQTREKYESQEPLPSKVDEPNAPDSVPSTLNTPQQFSSETHKPEPFKESPHVVEPTPATVELHHTQEPAFEEPPLTLDPSTSEPGHSTFDPSTSEPAPTPEPGHSTFDPLTLEPAPTPEPGHSTFDTTATTSDSPVETQESDKESEHDQWQAEDSTSVNDDDDDDGDEEDEEDDGGYEEEDEDDDDDDKDPYDDGGLEQLEPREEGGPEIVPSNQNERKFTRRFEELQQLHREQKEIMRQQELLHQENSEQQEDESSEQKQQQKQFDQQREDDQQQQQEQYNHQQQEERFISQQHSQDEEPNQQQNTPDGSETPPTTREDPPIPQGGPIPPINKREADTNTQFEHQTPTTIAEMTTPPCECPDIGPPPPCPKLGVDEYVPLPGSESGVMSLVEQYRVYVREMVLATFPQSIAEWIVENRPMLGVVCVGVAFLSLSIPLLLLVCISCGGQGSKKQVAMEKASRVRLEGERVKIETERNGLDQRLRESKEVCQGLEDDLKLLRGAKAQLEQANKQLQVDNQKVTESLTSSQQELAQYQAYSEQLNTQLANVNQELEETAQQRDEGIQTGREMSRCLTDLQNRVDGLEAQSEQLEQDKFRTQGALDTLQHEHDEATSELGELRTKCSNLDSELEKMSSDLKSTNATLGEKELELVHLRECLSQLTDQVAESTVDGEEGGNEAQLVKIKAMLDTSKAQQELQRTVAERDNHLTHILEKTSKLEQQIADNEALREQLSQVETKERSTAQELRELQIKMRGVTEYFQEKESGLHRKIELGEINQEKFKSLESEAQEKAAASEMEREREKEELKELRKQMSDIEKSFISQLKSNEERAEDALVQLRRTEQDLRLANREVTTLKRRLAEAETAAAHPPPMVRPIPRQHPYPPPPQRSRPPSTGPMGQPPQGPSPQPSRPLSAPRLEPRTSSPANSESMTGAPPQNRAAQSMLNNSLPMRGPRGQSDLPSRSHSFRGSESRDPHPVGAHHRTGPSPGHMQQVPSGPLPKLVEQPPRPYGVTPPPTEASSSQYRHPYDRPHNGPPMSHDRGYPPPSLGDYCPPDGPRRPYPPTRPPYGAPPPRGPPRAPYGPPMGPRPPRPGYPPQSMSGLPQRPRAPTQQLPGVGRPPAHTGGPPQTSQANKQPQAGPDFAV